MKNTLLEEIINKKLKTKYYKDFTYNGLQIEGCSNVKKIITGVTSCKLLLEQAVFHKAHAVIVHHGIFWDNSPKNIQGFMRKRLKIILLNNINLYSWHLPLDANLEIGNNSYIEKILKINRLGKLNNFVWWGNFSHSISGEILYKKIFSLFKKKPIHIPAKKRIFSVAWCSGKGQKFIHEVIKNNIDCFITGEISEETTHYARESNIHFFSVGHHATEKGGIKLLGKWLSNTYKELDVKFINIENPA